MKVKEAKVEDESIRDTILDLGNYCILTCAVLDLIEQKKNEQKKSECESVEDNYETPTVDYTNMSKSKDISPNLIECKG